MPRPQIVTMSEFSADPGGSASSSVTVSMPYHQENDILVLTCVFAPQSASSVAIPAAPAGWTASPGSTYNSEERGSADQGGSFYAKAGFVWWWRRADSSSTPAATIVTPVPMAPGYYDILAGCVTVLRNCVTYGDPFENRNTDGVVAYNTPQVLSAPSTSSSFANALALTIVAMSNTNGGISPGSPYTYFGMKISYVGAGAFCGVASLPVEVGAIPAAVSGFAVGGYAHAIAFSVVAIPAVEDPGGYLTSTSVPIRGMAEDSGLPMRLGCASEYEAFITGPDHNDRIDAVRWSSLKWERVLDDVSTATVVLPDQFGGASCCARFGGLVPWRYGLLIERDGEEVWRGAVTNVSRQGKAITVAASDELIWFRKRIATRGDSLRFKDNDAGQVLAYILNTSARVPGDLWQLEVPQVTSGTSITRDVVAREFSMAWNIVNELLESALDMYVLSGKAVVFQPGAGWVFVGALGEQYLLHGSYTAGGELVYGMFTEEAFVEIPEWSINGMLQANTGIVAGADSGESGFRKYWTAEAPQSIAKYSVLDMVETTSLYRPGDADEPTDETVHQRRADSLIALRAEAPAIVETVALTQDAPVAVDHLRPGSIWKLDVWDACYGQLLQAGRVKRVACDVQSNGGGLEERVSASLYPLGYTEGDV